MNFKLDISDDISFAVKLSIAARDGSNRQFAFTLQAKRMLQDELIAITQQEDRQIKDILFERVTGWSGQRLVLADDGQPAAFSAEAFAAMLTLVGAARMIFNEYILACGHKGKEKN